MLAQNVPRRLPGGDGNQFDQVIVFVVVVVVVAAGLFNESWRGVAAVRLVNERDRLGGKELGI